MAHSFEILKRKKGDVAILDLAGDLTLGEPERVLRDAVTQLVSHKQVRVILHLESVEYMDSSGVGALVRSHTTLARLGGRLKLVNPNKTIRQTLAVTGLLGVLEVYADEFEALTSF